MQGRVTPGVKEEVAESVQPDRVSNHASASGASALRVSALAQSSDGVGNG